MDLASDMVLTPSGKRRQQDLVVAQLGSVSQNGPPDRHCVCACAYVCWSVVVTGVGVVSCQVK